MSESAGVFVYGTLLFPEVTSRLGLVSLDPLTGREIPLIRHWSTLVGYERYRVKLRPVGNFPAIVSSGDVVEGELLEHVSLKSLATMDEFEGIAEGY